MSLFWRRQDWRPDIAIDLGTATTRVAARSYGIMARASEVGTTPALRSGVVVNGDAVVALLEPILSRVKSLGIVRPRALVCAPTDATPGEREAIVESVSRAGASAVVVVPEPLAAAVGGGVDVASPYTHMVIDIGEGVTDCAIIRSGKIMDTAAVRGGCGALRKALQEAVLRERHVRITKHNAELLLRNGISGANRPAVPVREEELQNAPSAMPALDPGEVRAAFAPVVETMVGMVTTFLRGMPHSIGCEIIENGISLTGGGALLAGMRERIQVETGITVMPVPRPLDAVVLGARAMLPIVAMLNMWKR